MGKLLFWSALTPALLILGFGPGLASAGDLLIVFLVASGTCFLIGYGATRSRVRGTAASVEHAQALDTLSSRAAKRQVAGR